LIRRAKQQSWLHFVLEIDHSTGREVPLNTLSDSMESASAIIQSSFRDFSSPQIPISPKVDSCFLKELLHASIDGDEHIGVNRGGLV